MIKGLHHNAYRCRDSEETRRFYEDFLGLPLVHSLEIGTTMTGRSAQVLHTFYQMDDGSFLAFFDDPQTSFEFKDQRDFDLHIALCRSGNNDDRRTEMKVQIRAKVWLEIRGEVAVCHGKAALLSEIRKLGSIRQAARSLQMSYRRAWEYVREIEEGVRVPVVARQAGGVRGGGAVLTPDGEKLLTRYEETLEAITEAVGPHGVDTV